MCDCYGCEDGNQAQENEEEAYFFSVLMAFETLVEEYGADTVIRNLRMAHAKQLGLAYLQFCKGLPDAY